jgi:D-alanyl-D-alanine carboxypeptidase (penicillin-binding protein 5/6)
MNPLMSFAFLRTSAALLGTLAFTLFSLAGNTSAQTPQPPEVAARQYLLIDLASNQVLAEREADARPTPRR